MSIFGDMVKGYIDANSHNHITPKQNKPSKPTDSKPEQEKKQHIDSKIKLDIRTTYDALMHRPLPKK